MFTPYFLKRTSLPRAFVCDTIQQWRETLLEKSSNPLPALRESFRLLPFDRTLAQQGVCMFHLAHIKTKNWKQCEVIQDLVQNFKF